MQLTKNQVEAVRYQLKKLDLTASNEDIRLASDNFEQFDALAIADLIIKNRTENIDKVDKEISEINQDQLKSLPTEKYEMVSHSQKMSLISEVSKQLNVQLSESKALEIASQISRDITDFRDLVAEIKQAIQLFIAYEVKQTQQEFDSFTNDVINQYTTEIDRVNRHMTTVSSDITTVLEVARQARKSRTQDYLKQFSVPSTKA